MVLQRKQKNGGKPKKPFWDIRGWLDYNRLRTYAGTIGSTARIYFIPKYRLNIEPLSLEQIMQRFDLTETDIANQKKRFLFFTIVMLLITLATGTYSAYHWAIGHHPTAIGAMGIMLFPLAMAFRYHFWYFQLKHGKIGCTFRDWIKFGLLGTK